MKRKMVCILAIVLCFTGCGSSTDIPKLSYEPVAAPAIVYEKERWEDRKEYAGETFENVLFAVGGEQVYIYGTKADGSPFMGAMKEEQVSLRIFEGELPTDAKVYRMVVDNEGYCHVLWKEQDEKTLYVSKLDHTGKQWSETPLGTYNKLPECFAVDNAGAYYIDNGQKIYKFGADGQLAGYISCSGTVEGIGLGKSGDIYVTYETEEGQFLGKVLCGEVIVQGQLVDSEERYRVIAPAQDADVLLYNRKNGVYSFEEEDSELKQLVPAAELPLEEMQVSGDGFMGNGRLCLLESSGGNNTFYYLPVEPDIYEQRFAEELPADWEEEVYGDGNVRYWIHKEQKVARVMESSSEKSVRNIFQRILGTASLANPVGEAAQEILPPKVGRGYDEDGVLIKTSGGEEREVYYTFISNDHHVCEIYLMDSAYEEEVEAIVKTMVRVKEE